MKKLIAQVSTTLLMLGCISYANAEIDLAGKSVYQQGLIIAQERKARDLGWGDTESYLTMTLRTARGKESVRRFRTKHLEVKGDGDKILTVFDKPVKLKGTAFLIVSHAGRPNDQWLYSPRSNRAKRIASRNASRSFMGSEFSYEDLNSFEIGKYVFKYLGDAKLDGVDSYIVEQVPTDKDSGYARQVVWLDKEHFRALKIDFYDRKKNLLKTLTYDDYKLYLDSYWRPMHLEMANHQNRKSTELSISTVEFRVGLTESDFDKETLVSAY